MLFVEHSKASTILILKQRPLKKLKEFDTWKKHIA